VISFGNLWKMDVPYHWPLAFFRVGQLQEVQKCEFVKSDTDHGAGAEGVAGAMAGP
jgi:hypothetical protein